MVIKKKTHNSILSTLPNSISEKQTNKQTNKQRRKIDDLSLKSFFGRRKYSTLFQQIALIIPQRSQRSLREDQDSVAGPGFHVTSLNFRLQNY